MIYAGLDFPDEREGFYLTAIVLDTRKGIQFSDSRSDFEQPDYHFYRQDSDGTWSHKANNSNISRIDASGKIIINPKLADRNYKKILFNGMQWDLQYNQFGGFIYVPNEGIKRK